MIFNLIVALFSGFMVVHKANTIKEDYSTPYTDCKVWGFEDGSMPSKIRWGANIGLDTVETVSSGMVFVDSISGGKIRTKAVQQFLGGFENSDDLKNKYSNVKAELLGESVNSNNIIDDDSNSKVQNNDSQIKNETLTDAQSNLDILPEKTNEPSYEISSESCSAGEHVPVNASDVSDNFDVNKDVSLLKQSENSSIDNATDEQKTTSLDVVPVTETNNTAVEIDTPVDAAISKEKSENLPDSKTSFADDLENNKSIDAA